MSWHFQTPSNIHRIFTCLLEVEAAVQHADSIVSCNISKQLIARQRQLIVRSVFNPGNFETLKSNEALSLVREITFQALA